MLDVRIDDLSIEDQDNLLRRVPTFPNMVKYDDNIKQDRVTSACFKDRGNGVELSVTLEKPLLENGLHHEDVVASFPNYGLAVLKTVVPRRGLSERQAIVKDSNSDDPYHALILGKKTKSDCRKLARESALLFSPIQTLVIDT